METRSSTLLRLVLGGSAGLAVLAHAAAGAPGTATPAKVAAAEPLAKPPPIPADGAGVYRLSLDRFGEVTPLVLYAEVRGGKAVQAMALTLYGSPVCHEVDAAGLALQDRRLSGAVRVTFLNPLVNRKTGETTFATQDQSVGGKAELTLDVQFDGDRGRGGYAGKGSGGRAPQDYKGDVHAFRYPALPPGGRFQAELVLYGALAESTRYPGITLRADYQGGASTALAAYPLPDFSAEPVVQSGKLTFKDGAIGGDVEVRDHPKPDPKTKKAPSPGPPVRLALEGRALGFQIAGKVRTTIGEKTWTTTFLGRLHPCKWPMPVEIQPYEWALKPDFKTDATMAKEALDDSLQPVLPGEPGVRGFWTWRRVVAHGVSVIHPPSFDLCETPGAASYKFIVETRGRPPLAFTADKPWRPLAPVWKDVAVGENSLRVVALDAGGKELPGKMRMNILRREDGQPGVSELGGIGFTKRPPFAGAVAAAPRKPIEAALLMARWGVEAPRLAHQRHLYVNWDTGGSNETSPGLFNAGWLWCTLAVRAITDDPVERLIAEGNVEWWADTFKTSQRITGRGLEKEGLLYGYKRYTPVAFPSGHALIDAWLDTGDARFKEMALKFGESLAALQQPNGTWGSLDKKPGLPPGGFFTWKYNKEFGAAEMLWVLGRLRRELGTDQFAEAEKKAFGWVMEHGVKGMFWPLTTPHSMSTGYPIWTHVQPAQCFVCYLLDCGIPAGRGDLKLAEDLARWTEDAGVRWAAMPGSDGQPALAGTFLPYIPIGDRATTYPQINNSLQAAMYLRLHRVTGKAIYRAKADALLASILAAQDPKTGYLNRLMENHCDLRTTYYWHGDHAWSSGWTARFLRETAGFQGGPSR
jgi:hypothetical protein